MDHALEVVPVKRQALLFLCLLMTGALLEPCFSAGAAWAEEPHPPPVVDEKGETNAGTWLVEFYRDTVSKVDGDRCPSKPSCSEYSLRAFRKHGFFIGWIMTVDRLIHEGSEETKVSPVVYSGGKKKIYDPVENNDFWWYRSEKP
jgi:putative component of membrane protein insertase Oxa1/YidC/SpoIIIJ protein YidD